MSEKNTATTALGDMPALKEGDRHLSAGEVAEMSGLSVATLRDYRSTRGRRFGPSFHRVNHRIVYSLNEVLDWLDSRSSHPGART